MHRYKLTEECNRSLNLFSMFYQLTSIVIECYGHKIMIMPIAIRWKFWILHVESDYQKSACQYVYSASQWKIHPPPRQPARYIIIPYWWYTTSPCLNDRVPNSLCLMSRFNPLKNSQLNTESTKYIHACSCTHVRVSWLRAWLHRYILKKAGEFRAHMLISFD